MTTLISADDEARKWKSPMAGAPEVPNPPKFDSAECKVRMAALNSATYPTIKGRPNGFERQV